VYVLYSTTALLFLCARSSLRCQGRGCSLAGWAAGAVLYIRHNTYRYSKYNKSVREYYYRAQYWGRNACSLPVYYHILIYRTEQYLRTVPLLCLSVPLCASLCLCLCLCLCLVVYCSLLSTHFFGLVPLWYCTTHLIHNIHSAFIHAPPYHNLPHALLYFATHLPCYFVDTVVASTCAVLFACGRAGACFLWPVSFCR